MVPAFAGMVDYVFDRGKLLGLSACVGLPAKNLAGLGCSLISLSLDHTGESRCRAYPTPPISKP